MPIICCPECGREIDTSTICPHCGYRRYREAPKATPTVNHCSRCGREYDLGYSACPHCGHRPEGGDTSGFVSAVASPVPEKSYHGLIVGVVALCILLFLFFIGGNKPPKESDIGGLHSSSVARVIGKMAVEDRLVSPSSAKFTSVVAKYLDNDNYEVRGSVEASNRLGVMVRQYFVVTYKATGPESATGISVLFYD